MQKTQESDCDALQLMTAKEVASLLRIKRHTLYQKTRRGEIPCVRIGGLVRYERRTIQRWIAAGREG